MELLPGKIREVLVENWRRQDRGNEIDYEPVVKLFTPDAGATWLLTELDPKTDVGFGLCDMGWGQPELGYVGIEEICEAVGALGLPIERDLHFEAQGTLSEYAEAARAAGRIVQLDEWEQERKGDEFSM